MQQIPSIEVRIRDFGQDLHGRLVLHEAEVAQYLEQGVERALQGIGTKIIEEACTIATQKIHEDVKYYLLYGEGGKALRAAVHHALEPLTALLRAAAGEEVPDAPDEVARSPVS